MPPTKRQRSRPARKESAQVNGETDTVDQQSTGSPRGGKRAFRCHFCAKEFLRNEHLQRHERLHTKEKPFRCADCSAGFTRSDLLARHVRLSHSNNSSQVPASCHEQSSKCARFASHDPDTTLVDGVRASDTEAAQHGSGSSLSRFISPGAELMPYPGTSALNSGEGHLDNSAGITVEPSINEPQMPWPQPTSNFGDFDLFIDNMSMLYGNAPSMFCVNQPILDFSPTPLFSNTLDSQPSGAEYQVPNTILTDPVTASTSKPHLFDEFASTFPSFEPSPSVKSSQEPWKVTQQVWNHLLAEIQVFDSVLPLNFSFPSRHTMTRYIATYFSGFHRHLPFLHLPTFSPMKCPIELILAMATIGAQSAFDHDNAIMLFRTSLAIAQARLRYRGSKRRERFFPSEDGLSSEAQPDQHPLEPACAVGVSHDQFDPLPLAQTLLILMAMATWGNSKAIFNEAVGLQNTLASYVRDEKLLDPQPPQDADWALWIQAEGFKRTIAIIFCFFIFHTIVYNIPPPILNSELRIHLPSREADWEARSEAEWREARKNAQPESHFQSSFSLLFAKQNDESRKGHSSLAGYTLILALIQHIYFLRETGKHKPDSEQGLTPTDIAGVEQALKNWQSGWYLDPESFLGPGSPQGPISFNSSALVRMAYIRLNVDLGPCRALNTHDPHEIAASINRSPHLTPSRRLTRAVLYSAHALSIPVRIGVNIVARNQAFAWSLQHSLCALECAFVISKWLIATQPRITDASLDEEEARLLTYIADMVAEADPGGEVMPNRSDLCVRVIKVWAKLLSGEAVWDVVKLIGKVLQSYGQILAKSSGVHLASQGLNLS